MLPGVSPKAVMQRNIKQSKKLKLRREWNVAKKKRVTLPKDFKGTH